LVGIYTRTGNRYRADYRTDKNRVVLRAGPTCRGGGQALIGHRAGPVLSTIDRA
jgi:hypothetical protein